MADYRTAEDIILMAAIGFWLLVVAAAYLLGV